jgi:hypothetical protein
VGALAIDARGRLAGERAAARRDVPVPVTARTGLDANAPRLQQVAGDSASVPASASVVQTPAVTVGQIVERAGRYVVAYAEQMALVIGTEHYSQYMGDEEFARAYKRQLVSEFALVRVKEDWLGFRDVYEMDGKPVGERQDRLMKLLLEAPEGAIDQGKRISDESARHNLGAMSRNFNVPTTALFFVHPARQARFTFTKNGEDTIDRVKVWKVRYAETGRPTIIRTSAGKDMPVSGTFWIDPVEGRIFKTHMEISSEATIEGPGATARFGTPVRRMKTSASITATYRWDDAMAIIVPAEMLETYEGPSRNAFTGNEEFSRVNCRATYTNFKKFQTTARIVSK